MEEKPIFILTPNIAVAVIPTIFFGAVFSLILMGILVYKFSRSIPTAFVAGLILLIIIVFFTFMNLRARRYLFYKDKAEFYEGFLNIVQRTVAYTKVTDCILTKSVWDRIFGTGTIQLVTAGHTAGNYRRGMLGGGVMMQYIKNPDETYTKVQKLLKNK